MVVATELSSRNGPELPIRLDWTIQMIDDLFLALEDKTTVNGRVNNSGRDIWRERYLVRFIEAVRGAHGRIVEGEGVRAHGEDRCVDRPGLTGLVLHSKLRERTVVAIIRDNDHMCIILDEPGKVLSTTPADNVKEKVLANVAITAEGIRRKLKIKCGELIYAKKSLAPESPKVIPLSTSPVETQS